MGRIFGTDGVRGVAYADLTLELSEKVGRAAAAVLAQSTKRPLILIGRDTRESGGDLEREVAKGLSKSGADVLLLGVVPTPAVAWLVTHRRAAAGVMISASHNPYEYNGIKLFGPSGYKLTDEQEEEIESYLLNERPMPPEAEVSGSVSCDEMAVNDYVDHIASSCKGGFEGRILVDCSNGSASATAREVFGRIGVKADFVACTPDGQNINKNCGSTHIENLCDAVVSGGYAAGFAFDGDADRLLAVDEKGNILDGDFLLSILSSYLRDNGRLNNDTVVVTTMSNLGFFKLMEKRGMNTAVTKVGDRYVLEEMRKSGHNLGGEQSGHMIILDSATTGDGQLSAVTLLDAIKASGKTLSELGAEMTRFPQVMINVTADSAMKAQLDTNKEVQRVIAECNNELSDSGRTVIRASGTEPLIRVMVEGQDKELIERAANRIAAAIKKNLK
ncbi:MAG: phosphoglucosamine mutase [Oscillospiraceae bacterium]|nr:phosphoglucosamine mutase [Oscillospiraceae bacterium]